MIVTIAVSIFCNYGKFIYEVQLQRLTKFSKVSYCRVSNCFLKEFMQNEFIYRCGSAKRHIIPAASEPVISLSHAEHRQILKRFALSALINNDNNNNSHNDDGTERREIDCGREPFIERSKY